MTRANNWDPAIGDVVWAIRTVGLSWYVPRVFRGVFRGVLCENTLTYWTIDFGRPHPININPGDCFPTRWQACAKSIQRQKARIREIEKVLDFEQWKLDLLEIERKSKHHDSM
jgi:hypothetical protein